MLLIVLYTLQKIEEKNKKKQIEIKYKLTTTLEINQDKVDDKTRRAGRLILATNELKKSLLSSDDIFGLLLFQFVSPFSINHSS